MNGALHELIGADPSATAVRCGDRQLTYAELDAAANRLAHHLQANGAGPEALTAICLPRTPELLIAIVAVLRSGSAYLPLDARNPVERQDAILRQAGPQWLITTGEGPSLTGLRRIAPDDRCIGEYPSTAPSTRVRPDNLAYVLHTSGSTGQPKGVAVTHRAAANYLRYLGSRWDLGRGDVALQLASVGYSAGVRDLLGPLVTGATVELVAHEGARSVERVAERLAAGGVTCLLSCLPQVAAALLDLDAPVGDLRLVMVISETFTPELACRIRRQWGPGVRIVHQYGLTECAMTSLSSAIEPNETESARLPIGTPIANTELYILDEQRRPALPGTVGEIYIGGSGLGRGYHHDPATTAERFIPNPFAPGTRLFRTGDLACRRADGTIEFFGRRDRQVKIRGQRVELDEVETALIAHPALLAGAVEAYQCANDRYLVGYIVPGTNVPTDLDLRQHLARSLPDHMVPTHFVRLPCLPVLPNGKIDRRALLHTVPENLDRPAGDIAEGERRLALLWQEILGVSGVGSSDDFFDLGAHSLHVIRLTARIRNEYGAPLRVEDVFANPTLGALAAYLQGPFGQGQERQVPAERQHWRRDRPLPLTPAQRSLWFLDRLRPGGATYTIAFSLRIDGPLDIPELRCALDRVVRRQEALRTTFEDRNGQPVAIVHPDARFDFTVEEPSSEPSLESRTQRPFDLARGPLLRVTVGRQAGGKSDVLVEIHHMVADDWSVGVFLADMAHAFGNERVTPLPVQYVDLPTWSEEADAATLAFWRDRLDGSALLTRLPTDEPRPAVVTDEGGAVRRTLPADLVTAVECLARASGATSYMVVLATWAVLLARWSGQEDLVIGTLAAGRHEADSDVIIGLFVNTVPVRIRVDGGATFRQLLAQVRIALVEALDNDIPFDRIVEHLAPERSPAYAPLVQVMCDWREEVPDEFSLGGARARLVDVETGTAKYDLWLSLRRRKRVVQARVEYRRELFTADTAEQLAARVETLLRSATDGPDLPLASLDLLPEPERRRMVLDWNNTTEHPDDRLLHDLVAPRSDLAAVRCGDRVQTYSEIDTAANGLAHHLQAQGCRPEALAAVCLPRTPELLVTILAALRTGCGYIPLDPAYPVARLNQMLDRVPPAVLVTTRDIAETLAVPAATHVLTLDGLDLAVPRPELSRPPLFPENVAYVLFTSGSTGVPKAVALTHRGAVNLIRWGRNAFSIAELENVAATTSVCFDLSVFEVFSALSVGGTVELLDDLTSLRGHPAAERVTLINSVPSAVSALMAADQPLPRLRRVNIAGEPLSEDLVEQIARWLPGRRVTNLYGPTETATYSTAGVCVPGDRVTIGRPIANTQVYILDDRRQPVAPGTTGEVHIGGLGLARGYHDQPTATAERFIPNPFAQGKRLYRTGDLARYRSDGAIQFLGRSDRQIKVRGHRIEPGEVECALRSHPHVLQAVVGARPDASGEARLVAWAMVEGTVSGAELRTMLGGQLPTYLVPSVVVIVDSLPLTPNGKIDQAALPDPQPQRAATPEPTSLAEQTLAGLWCDLLGLDHVGRDDSFFTIGGHSLLATRLTNRVSATFQIDLPVREIFEYPRLADLAKRIENAVVQDVVRRRGGAG